MGWDGMQAGIGALFIAIYNGPNLKLVVVAAAPSEDGCDDDDE